LTNAAIHGQLVLEQTSLSFSNCLSCPMPLVTISGLSIRYHGPPLLDGVDCLIENGQHIGLLGRNGAGKTTLFRILAGQVIPDHGSVQFASGARVALLQQEVPVWAGGTVTSIVSDGFPISLEMGDEHEATWKQQHAVDQILTRMELDPELEFETLSSGMKRRVLLARALVSSPDLLLLDEPTNHLDIDAIEWLENFLARWPAAFLFITHDRVFLRKLANRILEIEGGKLFDWSCDYDTFLKRKEEAIAAQEKQDALFDKRLAEEEVWIRQGIKARRTRNEGRVRALKEMRRVRSERRAKMGTANLKIQEGVRSGNLVVQVDHVSHSFGERDILEDFSTTIMRGDKVGIIGRNGAGKTTLLRILLGQLQPTEGKVRLGTNLQIAYFDQLRGQLDESKTIEEEVGDGYQSVVIDGKTQHIIGYLQEFLFTPQRARTLIKLLSGGERNRVLLAKLFAKPANVIVLDEPTNDLDAETLEMLEERLIQYQGTLLVVSHDREFLNNVVASCIAYETDGVREYVGGFDDWIRQSKSRLLAARAVAPNVELASKAKPDAVEVPRAKPVAKLSFKERQELDALPSRIEVIELQIAKLHEDMVEPNYFKREPRELADDQEKLAKLQRQLAEAMARWEILEARA
jgi:ABC transport system ATP-binding/permease protein